MFSIVLLSLAAWARHGGAIPSMPINKNINAHRTLIANFMGCLAGVIKLLPALKVIGAEGICRIKAVLRRVRVSIAP
jgi:hypothetical protein